MNHNSIDTFFNAYFEGGTEQFLSHVSINCVVFGYQHPQLKVLVHRMPGSELWMLPGGYVKKDESLDEAAYRNLKLSGITEVFLKQFRTFGEPRRVSGISVSAGSFTEISREVLEWVRERFITVVYYGIIEFQTTKVVPGGWLNDVGWKDVHHLDQMAMDHASIVEETRKMLATEVLNHPVAEKLLPDTFTLNELRGVFEAILHRSIDRGTFRRKMLQTGIVEKTDTRKESRGRPSHLFRFNPEAYLYFLAEETKFGF